MPLKKEELVKVFRDTEKSARNYSSNYKWSVKYDESELPTKDELPDNRSDPGLNPIITVSNEDTLVVAHQMNGMNKILVLNMASDTTPGGGVRRGSRAQEEELFRRSNYHMCVNRCLYPMKSDEFIVTEGVTVFKDQDYNVMKQPEQYDFIAVAAVRKPSLAFDDDDDEDCYMDDEDYDAMEQKISFIFRYAALEEYDCLVLGALGCGAYGNPNKVVAGLFKEAIEQYGSYFKRIAFAVLSSGDNDNYEVFKQALTV
jgi:uncharacterized protein (TIGR02452 family)